MTDSFGVAHETDGDHSVLRVRILCQVSRTSNARKMLHKEPLVSAETMLCEVSNTLSDCTLLTAMVANVRVSGMAEDQGLSPRRH
jgi:hypothetical protein